MFNPLEPLLNEKEVAKALAISPSWVRKQRFLRKHGKPHTLAIDPVMIGKCPRYRMADLAEWMSSLGEVYPAKRIKE